MFGPPGVEFDAAWPLIEPHMRELVGDRIDMISPHERRELCDLFREGGYRDIELAFLTEH